MIDKYNISITPAAAEYFLEKIEKKNALGLRLSVRSSGCSGYRYVTELVSEALSDDHYVVDVAPGVVLYVENKSLPLLKGVAINCVNKNLGKYIEFENPNATNLCGCGESFSLKDDADGE